MSSLIGLITAHLPSNIALAGLTLLIEAFALAVILNVLQQVLVPQNKNTPPLVFHYVPLIGSAVMYGMDPYTFFEKCRQKHGDVFTFVMLGRKITAALGPAGTNMILNAKLSHVNAEEAYTHLTTPIFGKDVVYDCPNYLLMEQKKFMKVGLSTDNFRAYIPMIRNEVQQYLRSHIFGSKGDSGPAKNEGSADSVKMGGEITICTASMTLQGKEVREGLDHGFADIMHDLDGGFTPINFLFPSLPLPSYRRRDEAHIKMRNFYLDIMNKRRNDGSFAEEGHDMIQALQGTVYKDGRAVSDREVAHMMIALLMAGEKPELQKAIWDEQVATYGRPDGTLAPLDLDKLQTPLINACVREVLRMHPPLHSLLRKVVSDMPVTHLEGKQMVIPKGQYVLAAPGVTQLDPRIWSDPHNYNPYRWFGENSEVAKQEAADAAGEKQDFGWGAISTGASSPYLPFGAGRHRCIGEQFAHVQLGTILATLVRESTWSLPAGKVPAQDYTTMIVMPKDPRTVAFKRRQS